MGGIVVSGDLMSANEDAVKQVVNEQLSELLGTIWNRVVRQINRLMHAHAEFGFAEFSENLNPSLQSVLMGFDVIDYALSKLLQSGFLEYEEKRTALNSRQCILKMKQLAVALDSHQKDDFERIMQDLQNQAP